MNTNSTVHPEINSVHPLKKTKLINDFVTFVINERHKLMADLIAYTNDPVRYQRRLRMMLNLSEYEQQILVKIHKFVTESPEEDLLTMLDQLKAETQIIVHKAA